MEARDVDALEERHDVDETDGGKSQGPVCDGLPDGKTESAEGDGRDRPLYGVLVS